MATCGRSSGTRIEVRRNGVTTDAESSRERGPRSSPVGRRSKRHATCSWTLLARCSRRIVTKAASRRSAAVTRSRSRSISRPLEASGLRDIWPKAGAGHSRGRRASIWTNAARDLRASVPRHRELPPGRSARFVANSGSRRRPAADVQDGWLGDCARRHSVTGLALPADRLLIRRARGDQVGTGSSKEANPTEDTLNTEGSECHSTHLHHHRRRHWQRPRTDRTRVSQLRYAPWPPLRSGYVCNCALLIRKRTCTIEAGG